jgi:predicted RNA-binding protein with TRAM domain
MLENGVDRKDRNKSNRILTTLPENASRPSGGSELPRRGVAAERDERGMTEDRASEGQAGERAGERAREPLNKDSIGWEESAERERPWAEKTDKPEEPESSGTGPADTPATGAASPDTAPSGADPSDTAPSDREKEGGPAESEDAQGAPEAPKAGSEPPGEQAKGKEEARAPYGIDTSALPETTPRRRATVVLVVCLIAIAAVIYLYYTSQSREREVVIEESGLSRGDSRLDEINRGQIIDATGRTRIEAKEGFRYKVLVEDVATGGTAGIARIGGLVTFIPGAKPGEIVIVEVTRLKETVAEAELVRRVEPEAPPLPEGTEGGRPGATRPGSGPGDRRPGATRPEVIRPEVIRPEDIIDCTRGEVPVPITGKIYRARIVDLGKKGDGVAKIGGKVVFVPGAKPGEIRVFRITRSKRNVAFGTLIEEEKLAIPEKPEARESRKEPARRKVDVGSEFVVTVAERSRRNPKRDGVARIDGLVVFIPETQPGDRVRIRIVKRESRFAVAEVIEILKLGGE